MAKRRQKWQVGGGSLIALVGVMLLIGSFVVYLHNTGRSITLDAAPLLFIAALVTLRVGVLMSARYQCAACGSRVDRTWTCCPTCHEPLTD